MKMLLHRLTLPLAHEFTIARESINYRGSLIVELQHDGISGFGEVTENTYYNQTVESLSDLLVSATSFLHRYENEPAAELWDCARSTLQDNMFALSALDMAAHDWQARCSGLRTFEHWGLKWDRVPQSSYTIGIDSIDVMVDKLIEQPGWPIYKIKLGTDNDLEIVRQLREHTEAVFRVDANCGWTARQTIDYSNALSEYNVEFIEQPLPADATDQDRRLVFRESSLPIIADESCQQESDVLDCAKYFHGINVKICKCGGLTPALRMLRKARELNLKTMVGCMIESSIGISGAAQVLPLLDYADLDGAVLLNADPAEGVRVVKGKIHPSKKLGHGARLLRNDPPLHSPSRQ